MRPAAALVLAVAVATACGDPVPDPSMPGVGNQLTEAVGADGRYISWAEHLIDDRSTGGEALAGSDGVVMGDLDQDGHPDLVSVHESDTEYDGVADGMIRASFGSADPRQWTSVTLAEGAEAGAAEDVAIGDVDGDGYPDVVAAVELAHLIYFQNPGAEVRSRRWARHIPSITTSRGSFIRVFLADFDADGRLEVVTANKGDQAGDAETLNPISWFELRGHPLDDESWIEHELTRVVWPINAQPVDLDGDGDLDVVGGSVAESRIMWFENTSERGAISFVEHEIRIRGSYGASASEGVERDEADVVDRALAANESAGGSHGVTGFNMDFVDLDGDGRLDILSNEFFQHLVWLRHPSHPDDPWQLHPIGTFEPDQLVGLRAADIDRDGDLDVIAGGYSRGPRDHDGSVGVADPLGRLAWFQNPGSPTQAWARHDISRRKRGMFDAFVARDMDGDGDMDFVTTRGNSVPYDGVLWLEQVRTPSPVVRFAPARTNESPEMPLADPPPPSTPDETSR